MIRLEAFALGLLAAASMSAVAADTAKPVAHSTRIIFLGTYGGPKAVKFRSEPASLLVVNGTPYLIDVGAGTDRQLAWAGFRHSDVRAVFITHHHIDHDGGLVPFIALTWFEKAWHHLPTTPLDIYGPPATGYLVHTALDYLSVSERIFRAGVPALVPSSGMFVGHDIDKDGPVYSDDGLHVSAAQNSHFFFPSHDAAGNIDKSYAYRFDTPSGSVVFTGDTGPSDAVEKLAYGADVLVSEVCACGDAPPKPPGSTTHPPGGLDAQEIFHMENEHVTPEEVGTMATRAHVKTLILTHFVPGDDDETDMSKYTSGVRKTFSGTVIAARILRVRSSVMRILHAKDRVATPWKNGGGTTSEVFVFPDRAGFEDFGWRVSIAQVDRSGPFSMFAGIDRHLAMLKGRVVLKIAGRAPVELSPETQPISFPGDMPTEAEIIEGPATDLNVMVRRTAFRATMMRRTLEGRIAFAHTTLAFPLARVTVNEFEIDKEDAVLADAGDAVTVTAATDFYWIEIVAVT